MKNLWQRWKVITKKIVNVQASIILIIIFILFFIPLGVFLNLFFKNITSGNKSIKINSFWIKRNKVVHDLKWAKEQ